MYLPKGNIIRTQLENFIRSEKEKLGYSFVTIPHIARKELYIRSGHMGKYDAMMPTMTDENGDQFVMKAMNCPHHFEIYNAEQHSYRSLPPYTAMKRVVSFLVFFV
jgi:threonyl-tRNA synthetase